MDGDGLSDHVIPLTASDYLGIVDLSRGTFALCGRYQSSVAHSLEGVA